MIKHLKRGDFLPYVGHVLGPIYVCDGSVEVWDQTLGCPECGQNLWDGEVSEVMFFARHPFQFDEGHDPGDEDEAWDWDAYHRPMPLGGWRHPDWRPFWHCTNTCEGCVWCSYRKAGTVPGAP